MWAAENQRSHQLTHQLLFPTLAIRRRATGPQKIQVQVREDGYQFDQIVLSSQTYLIASPGALTNDTTLLK